MSRLDDLNKRVTDAKARATAEGYEAPSGTYTFTNNEGAALSMALGTIVALARGEQRIGLLGLATLAATPEAVEVLEQISKRVLDAQCPTYISSVVEDFTKEARETDKSLS